MYGGTSAAMGSLLPSYGLSPRVRGNRDRAVYGQALPRSIPACTGEPYSQVDNAQSVKVYPRVYGGTERKAKGVERWKGLSPRVRGNQQIQPSGQEPDGSIPACTGEPTVQRPYNCPLWVYPRVYGGTRGVCGHRARRGGLSPRVRGNLTQSHPRADRSRSIPACTGEPVLRAVSP